MKSAVSRMEHDLWILFQLPVYRDIKEFRFPFDIRGGVEKKVSYALHIGTGRAAAHHDWSFQ